LKKKKKKNEIGKKPVTFAIVPAAILSRRSNSGGDTFSSVFLVSFYIFFRGYGKSSRKVVACEYGGIQRPFVRLPVLVLSLLRINC
jgi:hypothetical protein